MPNDYRILVVDDVRDNVEVLRDWLGRKGYAVEAATTGEEALQKAQDRPPDLILLDVLMPDLDGIEVARRLREAKELRRVPIILLTARRSTADKVRGLRAGADDYINKPFDFEEVDARITAMLEKRDLYVALERANTRLREANSKLKRTLLTDEKTQLFNYRHFCERAAEEFKRAGRYENDLSCIMLDLDHFKQMNDTLGHLRADRVLRETGRVLRDSARETDFPARHGGDEFVILCPHADAEQAGVVAERIRRAVADHLFIEEGDTLRLTASLGVATWPSSRQIRSATDLIEAADAALLEAKRLGRNRVVAARASAAPAEGARLAAGASRAPAGAARARVRAPMRRIR